jgi:outer membrane protein OmpA-like peptidoglycan-associated protein
MSPVLPSRKVAVLAAAAAGLTAVLAAAPAPATAAPTAATTTTTTATAATAVPPSTDWFVDPMSPGQRRQLIPVPADPSSFKGKLRLTRAVNRTKAGSLAVPMRKAFGHQLTKGQAVTLDGTGLFTLNSTKLTGPARNQLTRLAASLDDVAAVRCEGYSDYAGAVDRNATLAAGRAAAVCRTLGATVKGLETTTVSYGPTWPAAVGATSDARRLNRRVVVVVTRLQPPPPVEPTADVPGAPELLYVGGSDRVVYYTFNTPLDDGGSPITGYEVSTGSGWEPVQTELDRAADRTVRIPRACRGGCGDHYGYLTGVPNGSAIQVAVRAVNAIGAGAPSATQTTIVYGMPSAPTDLVVEGGYGTITATWGAPEDDGGTPVTAYHVSFDGGWSWTDLGADETTATVADLEAGTYSVMVQAATGYSGGQFATQDVEVLDSTQPIVHRAWWTSGDRVRVEHYQGTVRIYTDYQASVDGGEWVDIESDGSNPPTDGNGRFYFGSVDVPACAAPPRPSYQTDHTIRVRAVLVEGYSKPSEEVTIDLPA